MASPLVSKTRSARAGELDLNQRETPFWCMMCHLRNARLSESELKMGNMEIVVSHQDVERTKSTAPSFARRVLLVCLVGAATLTVWKLSDVLVLAFGAALLAFLLC